MDKGKLGNILNKNIDFQGDFFQFHAYFNSFKIYIKRFFFFKILY